MFEQSGFCLYHLQLKKNLFFSYNSALQETALVIGSDQKKKYFILKGDLRKEIEGSPLMQESPISVKKISKFWKELSEKHQIYYFWSDSFSNLKTE